MSTAQPVGLSSLTVGDIRLTLVPDGYHRCDPLRTFVGSTTDDWAAHSHLLDEHGRVVMTLGSLLAELPDGTRVLVDLGFGPRTVVLEEQGIDLWGGRLLRSLAALGLTPDDIDVVAYSHLHLDHVGWTAKGTDDSLTFANARHVMSRPEWEHWSAAADRRGGPTSRDLAVLSDRVEATDGAAQVAPGISIIPTPGHTPGHSSFLVTSGRERAVVLGDAIHCPLQITEPEWGFAQDANPDAARAARQVLLRELEQPDTVVAGPHFPNAIFGRVLPGQVSHRVAFDVVPPAPVQPVGPDAPPGSFRLPALAD